MLSGSCCSQSKACWSAPRFKNRQTWLEGREELGLAQAIGPQKRAGGAPVTHPVWPRSVAWCRGARPRLSLWFTSAPFCRRNSQMIKEPWRTGDRSD